MLAEFANKVFGLYVADQHFRGLSCQSQTTVFLNGPSNTLQMTVESAFASDECPL